MKHYERSKRIRAVIVHLILAAAVIAAAVLVRLAAGSFVGDTENDVDAFTSDEGIPYLTDMDSYYHVRLVKNYMENGILGDAVLEDGTVWDTRSNYPEGRSAEYQPGIVWLTAAAVNMSGGNAEAVEYYIVVFMSALSALAAYILGCRIGKKPGGLTAGLAVACAPVFVTRTIAGRFDTDMFIVLMELLLILFMTEAMKASSWRGRIIFAALFAVTAGVYSLCWTPTYSMLFAGLTLFAGLIFCFVPLFYKSGEKPRVKRFFKHPAFITLVMTIVFTIPGLIIAYGPSVLARIFSGLTNFSTGAVSTGTAVLPNLLSSISELQTAPFFPSVPINSFLGYVPGEILSVVNGIGGIIAFILCLLGLAWLLLSCIPRFRKDDNEKTVSINALYFIMLGTWLVVSLFLVRYGDRFVMHLSIPVGLLAGTFVGKLFNSQGLFNDFRLVRRTKNGAVIHEKKDNKSKQKRFISANKIVAVILCAAAVIPAVSGSAIVAADMRPTVTDASAKAMDYITDHAEDKDAVIASWWDMGYFYESESMHPCLWDGGTQYPVRGILVSKALTTDDPELSRRILLMLSYSGNEAVERLMEHADARTAFETLWQALPAAKEEGTALLIEKCGLTAEEADEIWALMRPETPKETYLVITYSMTYLVGWYEYFANWDFTGKQELPTNTSYSYTPEGESVFRSEGGQDYLSSIREKEMLWRLFFSAEQTSCFMPAFEWHDGIEHVRIWKVEP